MLDEACVHKELWMVRRQVEHEEDICHGLEENHLHRIRPVLSKPSDNVDDIRNLHSKSHHFSRERALLVNNLQLLNQLLVSGCAFSRHPGLTISQCWNKEKQKGLNKSDHLLAADMRVKPRLRVR